MSGHDDASEKAVEQLQHLGLSTYAARTFVGLTALGTASAKEVSEVTDVPRTRVYDAVEELQDYGIVDVQQSSPKRFWSVSAETAGRRFEQEYERRVERLRDALDEIQPVERRTQQTGVWTVTGQHAVGDRVLEFVESAEEEIVYMTVEELLTDDHLDALVAARERGVDIRVASMAGDVEDRIAERIPEAESFESLWVWSDTSAGRLLMVDRERTLVGVRVNHDPEGSRSETAIWGSGEGNALVVVLKALFAWRLDDR